jgi:hypothetical protein
MHGPDFNQRLPTEEIDMRNRRTPVLCVAATRFFRITELREAMHAISMTYSICAARRKGCAGHRRSSSPHAETNNRTGTASSGWSA